MTSEESMAGKFYAVRKGKVPGIYNSWDACKRMVDGYPGAIYKSFKSKKEAEDFVAGGASVAQNTAKIESVTETATDYAFVDGSFNIATGVYGFGGFLVAGEERYVLQGAGQEADMASMRNVAGEILGSMAAMQKALELGLREITIYYDYLGIEMWATGGWKRNKSGTIAYYEYVQSIRDRLAIHFVKVKGHSGVEGNEEADRLAKEAVGINEPMKG